MSAGRNTATRDRDRNAIRRTKPPCGICEQDIDYDLVWPDLGCYVVDHVIPIGRGASPDRVAELDVLSNKQAAHNKCNRDKWDTEVVTAAPQTFVTARTW